MPAAGVTGQGFLPLLALYSMGAMRLLTVNNPSARAAREPRARSTCCLAPNGVLRDASSAFGVCSACASRDSAVLASPPGSPRAAQGDELRLPRASAVATRNPQGSRGSYVLLCDARKQSAAAWVDRQAALGTQDAGPVLSPGGLLEGSGGLLSTPCPQSRASIRATPSACALAWETSRSRKQQISSHTRVNTLNGLLHGRNQRPTAP